MNVLSPRARRLLLAGALACAAVIACTTTSSTGPKPPGETETATQALPKACNPDPTCPGSTCATSITSALSTPPVDACPRFGESQSDVDVYSWNTFIAMNWPADRSTCLPNTQGSILGGQGPVVWETYPQDIDLFLAPDAGSPGKWCSFSEPAAVEKALLRLRRATPAERHMLAGGRVDKVLVADSKASELVSERFGGIGQAVGGPLTDQNGRFVRYEKRVNLDEYNYLITNNLWNAAGQNGVTVSFPNGQTPGPCDGGPCGTMGAMELKASWKVLSAQEIASKRFYTRQAWVFNDEAGDPSPGKNPVTVGLVGLHIIHKTKSASKWFWSTFEHVDNTTSSFFNPHCTNCVDNQQTAQKPYTELAPDGGPLNAPVQVVRTTPIQAEGTSPGLNAYYRGLLKGSVWANYQLISTQWATGGAPQGTPTPLANVTMETFIQPQSSCMGCHSSATTADGGTSADFSFLLGEAQ